VSKTFALMSDRHAAWLGPLLVFVVALFVFGGIFTHFPVLYDTDSYYHLAIARAYAVRGHLSNLPWARMSVMHEGFGDKEYLFHLLLAPFAAGPLSSAGGRWALAMLNALVATALAHYGTRAAGRWGLLVPLVVYAGSIEFLGRAIRLRPELLSLLLLLAAVACAASGRYRLLGAVAALYALSYTAFHALLGLCFAWFVQQGWWRRRWSWGLVLYPLLGVGVGLVVHPHFPHNLVVWKIQNIDFFRHKDWLDVGREITAQSADQLLLLNLAWILALAVLWRSAGKRGPTADAGVDRTTDLLLVATGVFGLLYLLMLRFSIYFIPFATLAVLFALRRRGAVGGWTALPGRGRLPLAVTLALVLGFGIARAGGLVIDLAESRGVLEREDDWAAFGRALPAGAKVAAEWGSTHLYMFWAPQATYLNVLDPVFMAVPFPAAHQAERALFEGREPDVPFALKAKLDCDFLALSHFHQPRLLLDRIAADPRLRLRYQRYTLLYETVPDANAEFVLGWRVVPRGMRLPVPPTTDVTSWTPYPRADKVAERALEGYVDADRVDAEANCLAMVHVEESPSQATVTWEFVPYGPSTLWIDDERLLSTAQTHRAVLGRGITLVTRLAPGKHPITVLTCRGRDGLGSGFYLRGRKSRISAPLPASGSPGSS